LSLWEILLNYRSKDRQSTDSWALYEEKLIELAKEDKQAGKQVPLLLVIDNVDWLEEECPQALGTLRDFAERMALERLITVVFVAEGGRPPQMLMPWSFWSKGYPSARGAHRSSKGGAD
jgi:hypothetical protein